MRNSKTNSTTLLLVLVANSVWQMGAAEADFGINSTGLMGVAETIPPPPGGVFPGAIEGDLPIVFFETSGKVGAGGLRVDHDGSSVVVDPTPAIPGSDTINSALKPTTLKNGTAFLSYMFHFDSTLDDSRNSYNSVIEFDNPIIGVQLFSSAYSTLMNGSGPYVGTLEAGDALIGSILVLAPGYYPTGEGLRGLEGDSFLLAINGTTLMLAGLAIDPEIDQIRILTTDPSATAVVPEVSGALTWSGVVGLLALGSMLLRRQGVLALV